MTTLEPVPVRTTLLSGATLDVLAARHVELRDPDGRLLLRYGVDGSLTIAAPAGDLVLEAPGGCVRLAARDAVAIEAPTVSLRAERARVVATSIEAVVDEALVVAERVETRATRLVTRARDALRETSGLVQERAGRVRLLVSELFRVETRATSMISERETSIDGSRIHVG
jgi:hypothetical protein